MRIPISVAMLLLCVALPVVAVTPSIQYVDVPPGLSFTVSGFCPFDVYEQAVAVDEKIATFYGQEGQITFQVITGVNKWLFMNVSTGKSIELNASGPATFSVQPGNPLVVSSGGGVSFYYFPNPPAGIPKLALTKGRVIAELDPTTFTVTNLVQVNGTVQDVCQLLE